MESVTISTHLQFRIQIILCHYLRHPVGIWPPVSWVKYFSGKDHGPHMLVDIEINLHMNYFFNSKPKKDKRLSKWTAWIEKIYYTRYFIRTHSDTKLLNKLLGNEAQKRKKKKPNFQLKIKEAQSARE